MPVPPALGNSGAGCPGQVGNPAHGPLPPLSRTPGLCQCRWAPGGSRCNVATYYPTNSRRKTPICSGSITAFSGNIASAKKGGEAKLVQRGTIRTRILIVGMGGSSSCFLITRILDFRLIIQRSAGLIFFRTRFFTADCGMTEDHGRRCIVPDIQVRFRELSLNER